MTEPLDDLMHDNGREAHAPPNGDDAPPSAESAGIGTRVSAVFTAAEKAANDVLNLAREQSDDIRRKAEAEAETHLSQRRSDAQADAMRVLAEAEAEAHRIRQTARDNAREIEDAARRREQRVREETDLLLDRVDWAREGIDDVISRLEDVRGRRIPTPPAPAPEADY
jgi:hypothetical protein